MIINDFYAWQLHQQIAQDLPRRGEEARLLHELRRARQVERAAGQSRIRRSLIGRLAAIHSRG